MTLALAESELMAADHGDYTSVAGYREPRTPFPPAGAGSPMTKLFKAGDHVSWNSEAGRVSGRIVRVHTRDVDYKGYVHHASEADPQYEIKSDKTDHVAMHKGGALRLLRR